MSGLVDNANLICLLIRKKRFEEAKWLAQDPTVDQQPGDSNSSGHRVPMVLDSVGKRLPFLVLFCGPCNTPAKSSAMGRWGTGCYRGHGRL